MGASAPLPIDRINGLPDEKFREELGRCCGSSEWVRQMTAARPYESFAALHEQAGQIWWALDRRDWLEAFSAHPRIGDIGSLRRKFADTREWASGEQSGVTGAGEEILRGLAEGNAAYEEKFGYLFIVCATGKSAGEMLAILRERLAHDPEQEIRTAAAEQIRITRLRIDKWLSATEGDNA